MFFYFNQIISNIAAAKVRSLLAIVGVFIGTASVVAMVSLGKMATAKAVSEFKSLGTDLLAVNIYNPDDDNKESNNFNTDTISKIKTVSPLIKAIAPYILLYLPLSFDGQNIDGKIIGTTHSLKNIVNITVESGRFLSFLDNYDQYCVIGQKIAAQLKQAGIKEPLGKQILLGKSIFTIIGIATTWTENSFFSEDINNAVLIPIQSANSLTKYTFINNIIIKIPETTDIDKVEKQITSYIKNFIPQAKLHFRSAKQLILHRENQNKTLTLLLGVIGSISLLVGGIGIMNIMLVSVIERRKEIGIRLAVGGRPKDIHYLFLTEAIILSFIGGMLGVIVGILGSFLTAYIAHWHFAIFLSPIIIGFLVSVIVGAFFGFYPAYQAAKLDPIIALRAE